MARTYVVLGAGPGLGLATARDFANHGFATVLVGRSPDRTEALADTLRAEGLSAEAVAVDLTDVAALSALIRSLGARHGHIDVLHFNPSAWRARDVLSLTPGELLEDLALGIAPLLTAIQAAIDFMPAGSRVLVTGSMAADQPSPVAPSLGVQKAGLRNLVTSVDATLAAQGVRAVAVQVNGTLAGEGPFAHDAVAEALYTATMRPAEGWTPHVVFDGSDR